MTRMIFGTVSLAAILLVAPALAQGTNVYSCTADGMAKLETMGASMTDATKKAAAMKHLAALKEAMAKNDMATCNQLLKDTNSYFPN